VLQLMVDALHRGGPFMWPLLAAATLALVLGVERGLSLFVLARPLDRGWFRQVRLLVELDEVPEAIRMCKAAARAPAARVVLAGLRVARRPGQVPGVVEQTSLDVLPRLARRTPYLGVLANVASLTGLLGSVQGLILAFEVVAHSCGGNKPAMMAAGIATALLTSLAGLLIAAPTLAVSALLKARTARLEEDLRLAAHRTVSLLGPR
jgi:biopolymer transport protein ExbB